MKGQKAWPNAMSGLVVTLSEERTLASQALAALKTHPDITVGELSGRWAPIALEGSNARPVYQWIEGLSGVEFVDVVFVSFPDPASPETNTLSNES